MSRIVGVSLQGGSLSKASAKVELFFEPTNFFRTFFEKIKKKAFEAQTKKKSLRYKQRSLSYTLNECRKLCKVKAKKPFPQIYRHFFYQKIKLLYL